MSDTDQLIAPCGMNCGVCVSYLAMKNECGDFPCTRLKGLDKRYRTKYHMSMVENLKFIEEQGMQSFLEKEEAKWRCPECGGTICCHNGLCLSCGLDELRRNRKYRWGEE